MAVELEWVLRSLYALKKATIIAIFNRLLELREIEFHEESTIEVALSLYTESNADMFTYRLHAEPWTSSFNDVRPESLKSRWC